VNIDWEALARQQGAFTVLDHEGTDIPTADFLATGEADIAALLSASASILGRDVPLHNALDFGCGVGRLTLPVARRAQSVTAYDIAPTMLAHARRNAEQAGLHNITYTSTLPEARFTFICSMLVFQYIPRRTGYALIRALTRLLASGGVALLHVMLAPRGEALRRYARFNRGATQSDASCEYDNHRVLREVEAAAGRIAARFAAPVGDAAGAVFLVEKK
jgi:2-polyprenyl-3-methyl-5-hydroxy-6-metoxy-1,4-benzoquinol methylase